MERLNNQIGEKENIEYSLSDKPASNDIFGSDIKFYPQDENILDDNVDPLGNETISPPILDNIIERHEPKIKIEACPKCGYKNLSNSSSCSFCGCDFTAPPRCPDCNYEISYNDTYCPYCDYDLSYNVLNAQFALDQHKRLNSLSFAYLICVVILASANQDTLSFKNILSEIITVTAYSSPALFYKLIRKTPTPKEGGVTLSVICMIISFFILIAIKEYTDIYFPFNAITLCFFGYLNYLILTSFNSKSSTPKKTPLLNIQKPKKNIVAFLLGILIFGIISALVVTFVPSLSKDRYVSNVSSQTNNIEIINSPNLVVAGQRANISIKGKPNTQYRISVYYDSGKSGADGLEEKYSDDEGYVSWEWKTSPNTTSGQHRIVISSGLDRLTTYFTTSQDDYMLTDDSVYVIEENY